MINIMFYSSLDNHIELGKTYFLKSDATVSQYMGEWMKAGYKVKFDKIFIFQRYFGYSKSYPLYHHWLEFEDEAEVAIFKLTFSEQLNYCEQISWKRTDD